MNVTEEEKKEKISNDVEVTAGEEVREDEPAVEEKKEEGAAETAGEEVAAEEAPKEEEPAEKEEPKEEEKVEEPEEEVEKAEEEEKAEEAQSEEPAREEATEAEKEEEIEEPGEEKPTEEQRIATGLPKPVNVGDELDVTIESVGAKGDGIAKKDGFVIFVAGVQKGDDVRIKVTELKTSFAIGEKI